MTIALSVLLLQATAAAAVTMPNGQQGMTDTPCPAPRQVSPAVMAAVKEIVKPGAPDLAVLAAARSPAEKEARAREVAEQRQRDWPELCRFKAANAALAGKPRPTIVLMGDSLTELWGYAMPDLFSDRVVNRGISGQTTPQMLARFYQDVIALHPKAVHIVGGGNDIAGNTGPTTPQDYENNIRAMVELAQANHIEVILGTLTPAKQLLWAPTVDVATWGAQLNAWLRRYARERRITLIDYYTPMAGPDGGMKPGLSKDGAHPTLTGYQIMRPLLEREIARIGR